ncbi:MAG: glycosyltransferase family 2 protein [Paludibacteraceae bacterium]
MQQTPHKAKVAINCLVYNHEPYLLDCLEGFVMQQTDFPFVAIVHDDASTDHSADIIREYAAKYPDIIHPIYETENQYSKKDGFLVCIMDNALAATDAEYVAMCEGDDYWTDPHKLKKQVDFMDAHPEYILTSHRYTIYNQATGTWDQDYVADLFKQHPEGFAFTNVDNFSTWITKTMTLMYRSTVAMPHDISRFRYWRDVHRNYYILKQGKGFCLPMNAAVYRRQEGGIFTSLSDIQKGRIGYLVMNELAQANLEDVDLQNHFQTLHRVFLDSIRARIQRGESITLKKDMRTYLQTDWQRNGFAGVVYSIRKMLLSFCYRFRK